MTPIDPLQRLISPTITDQEVALLPLADGRADLLEEIMSTPVLDHAEPTTRRTPPGWLVIGAAAAAVAAIALGSALGGDGAMPTPRPPGEQRVVGSEPFQVAAPVVPEVSDGRYVGLEVSGWDVEALYEDSGSLTIGWMSGDQGLEINRRSADLYAGYLADRMAIGPAEQTTLLGHDATTWAYSSTDHATMTEPAAGFYFEVRADGMPLEEYDELLAGLVQTDETGFYEGLPEGTVSPANRGQAIRDLLRGVTVPDGFGPDDVPLEGFASQYYAAVGVAGAAGCAWLDVYDGGTPAQQQQALAAFDGSRDWPVPGRWTPRVTTPRSSRWWPTNCATAGPSRS